MKQSSNTRPENVEGLSGLEEGDGKPGIANVDEDPDGVADEGADEVASKEIAEEKSDMEIAEIARKEIAGKEVAKKRTTR